MCQAAWLLTVAFGNLVVIIVAESSLFENRVSTTVLRMSVFVYIEVKSVDPIHVHLPVYIIHMSVHSPLFML